MGCFSFVFARKALYLHHYLRHILKYISTAARITIGRSADEKIAKLILWKI